MPDIITFADFQESTRDVLLTPATTLLSEATKNTYIFDLLFSGRDVEKMFKGGTKLKDKISGGSASNFGTYSPGDPITPSQSDSLVNVEYNWAFTQANYTHVEETTGLNEGDDNHYVELKSAYELDCMVNTVNGMEELAWALPNADTMEAAPITSSDIREPFSIPAFVTRDGEVPAAGNGGVASGSSAWSTIGTVNVASNPWFKNKFKTYDSANVTDLETGLIRAFDSTARQTKFMMPTPLRPWSDPANDSQRKHIIATNEDGANIFDTVIRSVNDRMAQFNDPGINGPQFKGVPVSYIAELDDAGWTAGSPDFFFLNLNFLFPFIRRGWMLRSKTFDGDINQPNNVVTYKFTHYNLSCRSRRRQGRVSAA